MSLYVLDTDTFTLLLYEHPVVCRRVKERDPKELAITIVTVEEQLSGWYTKLRRAKRVADKVKAYHDLARSVSGLSGLPILEFLEAAFGRFEKLKALKLNIGKKDLAIAAITQEHGGIVVSRNLKDFQRVPGLQVEDWSV